jgi:hypothetical protein
MENHELIWVDKDLAKLYNELNSDIEKCKLVNKLIEEKGLDITFDIKNLDDDLLRFKAFALNYFTEFKKVHKEQTDSLDKFFETNGYIFDKIESKTREIKNEVNKIGNEIKGLNKQMSDINTYKIERIIELINKFNNMSSEDKRIFEIILKSKS